MDVRPGRRADCVAEASGDLRFTVSGPGVAELVLRVRGDGEEVRLPLSGGTAVLPLSLPLREGRWDVYARGDSLERLASGLHDLRALVDRAQPADGPVTARVPYTTVRSNLSLAAWHRSPHAEAGDVTVRGGRITVEGRLYGTHPTPSATLEVLADGAWHALCPAYVNGTSFTATWHASAAPAARAVLGLRPSPSAEPVRLARVLDDVAGKEQIFVHPPVRHGSSELRLRYTRENELTVAWDTV